MFALATFKNIQRHIFLTQQTTTCDAAAYQLGNTSSRTITEVKQRWARLVLGRETVQVLPECCC